MWRCASRSIAGILGALSVHQFPAFAESNVITDAVGVLSASNSTTSTAREAASSTTNQPTPQQQTTVDKQQTLPNEQAHKPRRPTKLQQGTHFAVLTGSDGTATTLSSITAAMTAADVVLLGEYHDDPVAHALQLELLRRAAVQLGYPSQGTGPRMSGERSTHGDKQDTGQQGRHQQQESQQQHTQQQQQQQQQQRQQTQPRSLILSMEMFERDVQTVLDDYLAGAISSQDLMRDSRPWPNYNRDYAPMVQYCKQQGIKVVAANAPRRYVSLVGRSSRDALLQLSAEAQGFLAPLPYGQPSQKYVDKVQSTMRQAAQEMQKLKKQQQQVHKKQQEQQQALSSRQQGAQEVQQQGREDRKQQEDGVQPEYSSSSDSHLSVKVGSSTSSNSSSSDIAPARHGASHRSSPIAAKVSPSAAAEAADPSGGCPYIGFDVSSNFLDAQVLWDATMAHAIAQQLLVDAAVEPVVAAASPEPAAPKPLVIHVCGKFHCEQGLGIPEHLDQYAPGTRLLCVVFVPSKSMVLTAEEFQQSGLLGLADYVVLTDAQLPRSFDTVHQV